MTLLDKLQALKDSNMLPLHMPGHKRSDIIPGMAGIYGYDITEIDGFDDLHDPMGIIYDMQREAARLFGAQRAWISVGGSSAAIEAAIMASCRAGDEIIISRGSHKSVYYAVETAIAKPVYVKQRILESGIVLPPDPRDIEKACREHRNAVCVVITSPTYEGIVADIADISRIVHSFGMRLIVDGAHGAHLSAIKNTGDMPVDINPIRVGADILAVSLHKMLPAPTQTALLLAADTVDESRIAHYMQVLQSSSPSYILMAGVGECLRYISDRLEDDFAHTSGIARRFRAELAGLKFLDVSLDVLGELTDDYRGCKTFDPYKVVIRSLTGDFFGRDLFIGLLERYHIQCEMYAEGYALALFSVADDDASFDRLAGALREIDQELIKKRSKSKQAVDTYRFMHIPERYISPGDALSDREMYAELTEDAAGSVCGAYVCRYPPGIPIIIPGEIIDSEVIGQINTGLENGLNITGLSKGRIAVLDKHE